MNKAQRISLEREITLLIDRLERRENRIAKATEEGDEERVARLNRNDDRDLAKLAGIDLVLNCIGYIRRWDGKTDRYYLQKIG